MTSHTYPTLTAHRWLLKDRLHNACQKSHHVKFRWKDGKNPTKSWGVPKSNFSIHSLYTIGCQFLDLISEMETYVLWQRRRGCSRHSKRIQDCRRRFRPLWYSREP